LREKGREKINACRFLVEKNEHEIVLGRPRLKWEDNINIHKYIS
jgi:hypothetical protein